MHPVRATVNAFWNIALTRLASAAHDLGAHFLQESEKVEIYARRVIPRLLSYSPSAEYLHLRLSYFLRLSYCRMSPAGPKRADSPHARTRRSR